MSQFNPADTFRLEAEELLVQIEDIALNLKKEPSSKETVDQLFRAFHTIKGSGSMFGFDEVASFTHHVETSLDMVREGSLTVTPDLIDLVLAARDHLKTLLDQKPAGAARAAIEGSRIIAAVHALCGQSVAQAHPETAAAAPSGGMVHWRIRFRPHPEELERGTNIAALLNELREMGECTWTADTGLVPSLQEIQTSTCYLAWRIDLYTVRDLNAIKDVFIFVDDSPELTIERMEETALAATSVSAQVHVQASPSRAAPIAEAAGNVRKMAAPEGVVRVPSGKLDRLVNLVGELVMNQSRLTQAASTLDSPALAVPVEEIERLVAELRDSVLGIRMMPIGATFNRFKRLVHDLSAELGKEIDLVTEGEETELDKTVLDQLADPLVHLIRNSVDHGIETGEERVRAGKPSRGTVRLTALHTGSNVVVSIRDDGRGLDAAKIRAKAVQKGLIAADAILSEKEILNLIFLPGFSTAAQLTNISGRGVGMDVVRRQIDALRGSVSITTEPGARTTIELTLPLTLAIIDGLLVEIAGDQFIVPMSVVTENVELHRSQRDRNNSRNIVVVRGELVPYIHLREAFRVAGDQPEIEKVVIVQHESERVGLVVDRVLGSHQTVIQSLGNFYRNVELASGATIMGDGRVALILDVTGLVRFDAQRARAEIQAA